MDTANWLALAGVIVAAVAIFFSWRQYQSGRADSYEVTDRQLTADDARDRKNREIDDIDREVAELKRITMWNGDDELQRHNDKLAALMKRREELTRG